MSISCVGHPHLGALALHTAFEQVARTELAADLARVLAAVTERERRGARNDIELREARDLVQDRLGDAKRKYFPVRVVLRFWNGSTAIVELAPPAVPRSVCRTSRAPTAASNTPMITMSALRRTPVTVGRTTPSRAVSRSMPRSPTS